MIQTTGKTTIIFNQKPIAKIKINTGMKRIFSILVFAGLCYVAQGQYTFECYGGYLSGADCQICTGQTTARLFNGLIIRQGANVFRLIDCPYFIRQQGNNLIITELIPNPESVTINLLSSGFSTVTGFRDSIACMCARQDSSWIGGGGGSTYYQTWKDDGTALTQQPNANFLQSDDINISLTNDGGNTETEVSADILTNAVNYAEIQQGAANLILGIPTGRTANVAEIPLATGLFFAGGNLNVADRDSLNEAWTIDADDADLEVISNQIVKFQGGGINVTDYVPATNTLIITGTEVDGSTTNELQTIANTSDATSHTATLSNSGGSVQIIEGTGIGLSTGGTGLDGTVTVTNTAPDQTVSITGAGINVVTGTYPNFTITGTEVDGSVTNEGSLTVGAGGSNTSTIVSNTSGSTAVTVSGSTTVLVTESGSTITLQADTSLLATVNDLPGRVDSTFEKTAGGYTNKRTTTPVFRYAPLAVGSTDTTGRINILGVSTIKPGAYMRYLDASVNGFNWLKLDPDAQTDNSTVGSFYGWATNFVGANVPYSSRANHVWRMGYNTAQAGGRIISTDADLHMAFESNFTNVFESGRTKRSWEWHIESQDTVGGIHRLLSGRGSHDGKDGDISFAVDNLTFQPYNSSTPFYSIDWTSQNTNWQDTMRTYYDKPMVGIPFFTFRNAANSAYLKMFQPDASDRLVLNPDGNALYTYANEFIYNTLGTITTADGNPVQIGNSTYKSFPSVLAPGTEVLRLKSNTGGSNQWSTYVNSDNVVYSLPSGSPYFQFYTNSTYLLGANDRIGIGTSPGARFHVRQNANTAGGGFQLSNSDASFSLYQALNATGDLAYYSNGGSQRLILTQGGSLGITSGTPARTLHVTGEARITDLTTDSPTQIVGADADGDLGAITVGSGLSLSAGTLTATATGLSGSGVANQIAYWSGTSALAGSSNLTWDGTTHNVTGKGVYAVGGSFSASSIGVDMSGNMTSTANNVNLYGLRNSITFANAGTQTGNSFRAMYVPTSTASSTAGGHVGAFIEPTNSSPNVTSLYGVQVVATESSASGNLSSRYALFGGLDKTTNNNTTHAGVGVKSRVRDNSASGRWGTIYGFEAEIQDGQNAYGAYISMLNQRSTANNQYGVRIGQTVSGSGVTATNVVGVDLTHTESSSGAITNYYGIRSTTTPAADNNYAFYFPNASWIGHINGSFGVGSGTTAPARTFHNAGETRLGDLVTDTPTKIVGADADGDLDTVGIGAEAELHLTNGTLGTNFHTTISPTSITANQTDYNPSGLATAWVVRLSADDGFRIIRSLVAPSYNKRITFHNAGSNSILFANQCAFSGVTASYRFDFGRDIILFPGKSIEIMYDVTSSRWRLLSKAGIYDDVEHLYFNERLNAPVSGSSGDYYFWDFVSENGIGGVAPVAGRLSGISVNTGSSATGIGYVASKDVFFENTNASGTANWAYCKALIKTPADLSNGTEDYTIRIGFADATGGGGANDGFYFDYNHANVSGNWGCNTTNAGNTQRNNSGIAVTASTNYLLEVFFRPDLTAEYYINGTRVATNDTFVPAGTSDDLLVMAEIQKNASTAQRTLTVYTLQTSIAFVK